MPVAGRAEPHRLDSTILAFAAATYAVLWALFHQTGRIEGCQQHTGMAVVLAATVALLAWNLAAAASYCAWRHWSITAYQLASPSILAVAQIKLQLEDAPVAGVLGAVGDVLRVLTGCRCHILFYNGAGLALDLGPQMAVQALSIAGIIAFRTDCQTPLLDNQLMEGRIRGFHAYMSLSMLGVLPPSITPLGRKRQCAAVLDFLLIFVGWLLPTFLAARTSYAAALAARRQGLPPSRTHRLSIRLMRYVFLEETGHQDKLRAWLCLTILCWLVASLTAAASGAA